MTDREALLRAIKAAPDDDNPRLVYADYLEEQERPRLDALKRLSDAADGYLLDGTYPPRWSKVCRECFSGEADKGIHLIGCSAWAVLREADAIQKDELLLVESRDKATLDFIRMTCGVPERKRAKTKMCLNCRGWGNISDDDPKCEECGGKGRVPNDGPRRYLPPKPVAEWLRKNWLWLLPALTKDLRRLPEADVSEARLNWWEVWETRNRLNAGIPFVLPSSERQLFLGAPPERVYTPHVRLYFHKGFLSFARWQTTALGKKLAALIAQDQPLAIQNGPGAFEPLWAGPLG